MFIIEANPEDLRSFVDETGFRLEGFSNIRSDVDKAVAADDVSLLEAVVVPNGQTDGRNAAGLHLHSEYGVNLLAVSRNGSRIVSRLSRVVLQAGDVLLLQGRTELMLAALPRLNLLPLADRDLRIGQPRRLVIPITVFVGALLLTIFGLLPIHVSLVAAVTLLLLSRFITLQSAYQSINWPIIVLLGAMIPVGGALESTGGAARIAGLVTDLGHTLPPWTILAIVLVTTMLLSDVVNNSTAVILMAPVAMGVAETMGASFDPFLMAVAIGGSSAFLTPIGHQSNTIVMGPGGYKFGDYWRMGLPLDVIIVSVSVPLIMWFWPLGI